MQNWSTILTEIRDFLNSETYTPALTVSRSYLPKNELIALPLTSYVMPSTDERELMNRAQHQVDRLVAVFVTQKVDVKREDFETNLDEPLSVVSAMMDSLRDKRYSDFTTLSVQNAAVYDFQKLAEHGIFQSLILVGIQGYADANR